MGYLPSVCFLLMLTCGGAMNYTGHQLVTLRTRNQNATDAIFKLISSDEAVFDLWKAERGKENTIQILVAPRGMKRLDELVRMLGITMQITVNDLQGLITQQNKEARSRRSTVRGSARRRYHYKSLRELNDKLQRYAKRYFFVHLVEIGRTYEGRQLSLLRVSKNPWKPIIWINAGMHAREWISTAATLYVLRQLLTRQGQRLLENYQFIFVPMANPDGYAHSIEQKRTWRKNLSRLPNERCRGVDLNRNFNFHWGAGENVARDPCKPEYIGQHANSELETKALQEQLDAYKDGITIFIDVHSYGNHILIPFGYSQEVFPYNYRNMVRLGRKIQQRLFQRRNYEYQFGRSSELLYITGGGIDDYVSGVLRVPYVYTIELPSKTGTGGFITPISDIPFAGGHLWTVLKTCTDNL